MSQRLAESKYRVENHTIVPQKSQRKNTGNPQLDSRQAKGFIPGFSARRTKDLLKLSRDQLRWVVGLFTGHCHPKGHLLKLGLTDEPTCERCLEEGESATRVLCNSEALPYLRFRHLGPNDYYNTPIFHSKCRIDEGLNKRGEAQ
jgi:hypothetical protein